MNQLTSKEWWIAAGIRALKTIAQSMLSSFGVTAVTLGDVNWPIVMSTAGLAGLLSLITSIAGLPEVEVKK